MTNGFWDYLKRVWDNPLEYTPHVGTYVLIWTENASYPIIAKFIVGDEDDGVFEGQEVWKDDSDSYYLPDSVEAWMPCPPRPEWLK